MCGIVGFIVHKHHKEYAQQLEQATFVIKHRGPDSQNTWSAEDVGLGHTRLSILDLSENGNQPMKSIDGRYIMVFNGQVYNYLEIAKTLRRKFNVYSDTRVVLEAIAELGIDKALTMFNGMFALAVYDLQLKKLYLARDAVGIKPLYWASTKDGYVFASELKSLREFKNFNTKVDSFALANYFSNQYIQGPLSIYTDCQKLMPGHLLEINGFSINIKKFYPITANYDNVKSHQEAEELLENLLISSIERHSRSDVPFSAFLSGGVDSSLIVSILSKKNKIDTYSVGYDEQDFDESKRAQKIAAYLGVKHNSVIIRPNDIKDSLTNIASMYDEPFADSSCLPTNFLSNTLAKQTKIAFSGDGADELFAGYPRYFNALKEWEKISFIPYPLRKIIASNFMPLNSKVVNSFAKLLLRDPGVSMPYIKKLLSHEDIWQFFCSNNYLGLPQEILNEDFLQSGSNYIDTVKTRSANNLDYLLQKDQRYRLPDAMLTKVDRASMQSSLEVRVPFLDNEIIAFSRALAANKLIHNHEPKFILKKILAKYIPEELFLAPKTGFHIPMKIWLATHFRKWAEDLLFTVDAQNNLINIKNLRIMWDNYTDGNSNLFYPLWTVIMYRQWERQFSR